MTRATVAIMFVAFALGACKPRSGEAPPTQDALSQEAIKALGSTVPMTQFDRDYWQQLHDANTPDWQRAKRLCEQTILANYPNCLPVNNILQADERKKAEIGDKAAAKIQEMSRHGYLYDYSRKLWLPAVDMQSAGCLSIPAYPNDRQRIGFSTWKCPGGTKLPQGIPDKTFSEDELNVTN